MLHNCQNVDVLDSRASSLLLSHSMLIEDDDSFDSTQYFSAIYVLRSSHFSKFRTYTILESSHQSKTLGDAGKI